MSDILEQLGTTLYQGDEEGVVRLTREGLEQGLSPQEILNDGLLAGMKIVGVHFRDGEMFIPEVILCANCMHAAMAVLKPLLMESESQSSGKIVIGTVEGDLHDIGKNLCKMMFECSGFEVIDLGIDVAPDIFIEAIKEHQPDIVGMSALLTTTMPMIPETIGVIEAEGLRNEVKLMVGGAPLTESFAADVGADAYAENATVAVEKAKALLAA